MKEFSKLLLILIVCLPFGLVSAQGGQPVELPDGTEITLPDGWEFAEDEGVYIFAHADGAELDVWMPEQTAVLSEEVLSPEDLLALLFTDVLDLEFDADAIEATDDGVTYGFEGEGSQGMAVVQERVDGLLFYVFSAPASQFEQIAAAVDEIVAQLPVGPATGAPVDCFVSANKNYGVPLRLGPGLNRGEYSSLTPQDGEVRVIGQTTADDGSLWWRIEENDAAVNELWVADTDVTTSGSCAMVGAMEGQGIVAPAPGFVPAGPTPGSGEPPAPPAGGATTDTSLVPRSGTWYLASAPEMLFSCEGGATEREPSPVTSGNVRIVTSGGGATLTLTDAYGTMVFTRGGPGFYTYQEGYDTLYLVWYIHVNAPTVVYGEITAGFTDIPCSGTLPISFTFVG